MKWCFVDGMFWWCWHILIWGEHNGKVVHYKVFVVLISHIYICMLVHIYTCMHMYVCMHTCLYTQSLSPFMDI